MALLSQRRILILLLWIIGKVLASGELLEDDFILVVDGRAGLLHQLSLDGAINNLIEIPQQIHPVAVDYDPVHHLMFWTDVGKQNIAPKIGSAMLNGSDVKTVKTLPLSASPEGIAVDPTFELIFYSDNGANTINVLLYNGTVETTIVTSAFNPRDVKLDTVKRHVYWADWGTGTIERCNYDGSNREILYQKENSWINTIDLDLETQQMFWTDARYDTVMSASINDANANVKTVIDASSLIMDGVTPHYYGIAIDDNYIYLTDWTKSQIFRANRTDGSNYTAIGPNIFTMLNSLHIYEARRYFRGGSSPCKYNGAGCSTMCLPVGNRNFTCACPEGQELKDDKLTCFVNKTQTIADVIWLEYDGTGSSYIRGIKGEPSKFTRMSSIETWRIHSPLWHWKAADVNVNKQMLYLVDGFDKSISQLSLNGTLRLQGIYQGLSPSVNGLAYDWLSDSLYWTDGTYNWIQMCKAEPRTQYVKTLVSSQVDSPHGIAVHPVKGYMFWTDWGIEDKIERANLAGGERKVLVKSPQRVYNPTGITVDYTGERIYWSNQHDLMSATFEGSDIQRHYTNPNSNLVGISYYDNYIMATDQGTATRQQYLLFLNVKSPNIVPRLGLPRYPSDVVMYHKGRQPGSSQPMNCSACAQLCVSNAILPGHIRCVCGDGFNPGPDGTSCVAANTSTTPGFIFSMGDKICSVPYTEVHNTQINADKYCFFDSKSRYDFAAMDFDFNSGEIYFSEVKYSTKTIRRSSLSNTQNNEVIVYGVGEVYGLAYDYSVGNIYWTDYTSGQIWVARRDGSHQKLLVSGRTKPRALTINMKSKLLYWSELTSNGSCVVMSSNLDGTEITPFVTSGLENVTGLVVDYTSVPERLWWIDYERRALESVTFSTSDRKMIQLPTPMDVYDLAIFENFIAVTDADTAGNSGLHIYDLNSGIKLATKVTFGGYTTARAIIGFNAANQKVFGGNSAKSCGFDNGFCQQLCLLSGPDSYNCACMDGMVLDSNRKSCKPANNISDDKFLLVADDYRHTVHVLDPADPTSFSSLSLPHLERPIAVTFNPADRRLIWTDFDSNIIKSSWLNGTEVKVVRTNEPNSIVEGLAVEPNSGLIYYTDAGNDRIGVVTVGGDYHKVMYEDEAHLVGVRSIAIHSSSGYMFVTTRGKLENNASITRIQLDGRNPTVIVSMGLVQPRGLAIDYTENKLYWMDGETKKIERSDLDGSNRQTVWNINMTSNLFGIAVAGERVYWTDWLNQGVYSVSKSSGFNSPLQVLHKDHFRGLNGIFYADEANMLGVGTCAQPTECSHMCAATPGQSTCICPDRPDGSTVVPGDMKDCSSQSCPTVIPNGKFNNGCTMVVGTSCTYTCDSGFKETMSGPLSCQAGFEWSVPLDTLCTDVTCSLIFLPPFAEWNNRTSDRECSQLWSTRATPGVKCVQQCQSGFLQRGGLGERVCQADSFWTGTNVECLPACLLPSTDVPPFSTVTPSGCVGQLQQTGTVCRHQCRPGYTQTGGNSERTCQGNREWSGSAIVCQKSVPPTLPRTTTTTTTTTTSTTTNTPPTTSMRTTSTAADLTDSTTATPVQVSGTSGGGDSSQIMDRNGSSGGKGGIVAGVLISAAIVAVLVIVGVYVYKRRTKMFGRYRDTTNFDGMQTHDKQPVVGAGNRSPSYHVSMGKVELDGSSSFNNNVYVSQQDFVKQDGSVGFENPMNLRMEQEDEGTEPMAGYSEIGDMSTNDKNTLVPTDIKVNVASQPQSVAKDRTAFSNPLYENLDQSGVDLGESTSSVE